VEAAALRLGAYSQILAIVPSKVLIDTAAFILHFRAQADPLIDLPLASKTRNGRIHTFSGGSSYGLLICKSGQEHGA
jgi:hypothetical protein